jgi:pimeloyl-ACP methyl ester carboxylesterase
MPSLPAVASTDGDGPFKTKAELNSGPSKTSGVFRPAEVGQNGVKHPIFIFGCGGTTTPDTYQDELSRIASHGFVVVGEVEEIGDNGAPLKTAIDWVVAENARADSALYQHLDTTKIALGGHSIGSVNSFYIATDPRLTTTIHIAGGSLDNVRDPFAATTGMGGAKLVHPVAYVCSMSDAFGNVEKTEKDYTNTKAPAFMTVINGADHVSATKDGLPVIIAWLRWQLAGETDRRASFLDASGTFSTGKFVSKNKNW